MDESSSWSDLPSEFLFSFSEPDAQTLRGLRDFFARLQAHLTEPYFFELDVPPERLAELEVALSDLLGELHSLALERSVRVSWAPPPRARGPSLVRIRAALGQVTYALELLSGEPQFARDQQ